ncbi:hypothetical protein ACIRG4_30265, partial [Streptomyces sp. NPDC102395]|uniref:hypothetical protein n=1 Tax=Streptomyces sp. NPDC102395 TaxID=3366168 RepID=UPI0037F39C6D
MDRDEAPPESSVMPADRNAAGAELPRSAGRRDAGPGIEPPPAVGRDEAPPESSVMPADRNAAGAELPRSAGRRDA